MTDTPRSSAGGSGIGRATLALASGTVVSRLLGFVKAVVLAQTIGVTGSIGADMFGLANQLPNNVYTIVAGGTLNAILVPQIVRAIRSSKDGGQSYVNKLLSLSIVLLGGVTVLAVGLAPVIVGIYSLKNSTGSSPAEGAAFALAVAFAFWCLPQIFFYGLYTMLGEILNAKKVFGPFAWAPVLNNVIAIGGLVAYAAIYGVDVHRAAGDWTPGAIALLAGSATLGVAGQALILLISWRKAGLGFRFDLHWRGIGLRETAKIANWMFAIILITQLVGLVQTNIASFAVGASIAALQTAWLIFMLPHSVVTVSVATAYFTRMSEHAAEGDIARLRRDFSDGVRACSMLVLLASAAVIVVALPLGRIFAKHPSGAGELGLVIALNMVGAIGFCIVFLVQRAFFAMGDTKTPFFFTLAQLIAFTALIVLGFLLLPREYLAAGITAAYSVSYLFQAVLGIRMLRRRWHGDADGSRILAALRRFSLALVPTLAVGVLLSWALGAYSGGFGVSGYVGSLVTIAVVGVAMALVYLGVLAALRAPEVSDTIAPALRGVRRRLGR